MSLTLPGFFFDTPLYSPIGITAENKEVIHQVLDKTRAVPFVGYNPIAKIESTFEVDKDLLSSGGDTFGASGGIRTQTITCKRTDDTFYFILRMDIQDKTLTKIGQYPSVADFHIYEVKQYTKLLSSEKLKEFTRGIGLAANGVGIGSFVYLRRIFEHLIHQAFEMAKAEMKVDVGIYKASRMSEKIDLLRDFLPAFLVENKAMYSILSVGVHELEEQDCLAHFDALRVGIEIILDEKLDELRKTEKMDMAKKKIQSIQSIIKK